MDHSSSCVKNPDYLNEVKRDHGDSELTAAKVQGALESALATAGLESLTLSDKSEKNVPEDENVEESKVTQKTGDLEIVC